MKGYRGLILRVNLTEKKIIKEKLSLSLVEKYLGGKGIGTYLHYQENQADIDALSPENKIIVVAGPGAGTIVPTATRVGLFAKAPLNSVGIDSYLGGSFGHFMKKAGYDVMVIEGKSKHPAFIQIFDENVVIEDASFLWGKDIYETEDLLKAALGNKAKILSIGPAGENLVRYACIGHDYHRHFGRMGVGALMGSKNLKAVALIGTGIVDVYDHEGLKQYVRELNTRIKEHPGTGKVYPLAGTVNFVSKANSLGVFPSHYWQEGEARHKNKIDFEYIQKTTLVRQSRCYGCPIGCAHINRIKDGPYAGIEIDGPEFETIYVFGGLCDVGDIREIIKLNDVCDRMGVDTMHTGNVLGLLMSATEKKKIPDKYRIEFGDTEKMLSFIEKLTARRNGWHIVGEGLRSIAKQFNLKDMAVHVKGLEPAGYDPRGVQSMAITYGVGNRGATHLSSNSYARDISGVARDFELSGEDKTVERFSLNKKAELVYNMINFNAIADCFIFCRFLNRDLLTWEDYSTTLYLLTGIKKSKNELVKTANNIVTLGRLYNIKNGLNLYDDLLPERFYTEPNISEGAEGKIISKKDYMEEIKKYYSLRGWNEEGIPEEH
ncbi:MAG: aldehyde ferredoxin oxidoreductase family protein [Spirochaetes bacterium]|nr:aldehyde ferredoxin oxidoreductase family protein [Spirochaetota bacterium]